MNPPLVKSTHNPVCLHTSLLKEPQRSFQRTLKYENIYKFLVSLHTDRFMESPEWLKKKKHAADHMKLLKIWTYTIHQTMKYCVILSIIYCPFRCFIQSVNSLTFSWSLVAALGLRSWSDGPLLKLRASLWCLLSTKFSYKLFRYIENVNLRKRKLQ